MELSQKSEVVEINNRTGVITEDLISIKLPDDLFNIVLSKLPIREAARSSILSTRFRNLWRDSLSSRSDLVFDLDTVLGLGPSCVVLSETQTATFIRVVNQTLNDLIISCHTTTDHENIYVMEWFKVHCNLKAKHTPNIDQWVKFAVTRGVRKLHLLFNLQREFNRHDIDRPYTFDFHLLSGITAARSSAFLEELILRGCLCDVSTYVGMWRTGRRDLEPALPHLEVFQCLRSLTLEQVGIDGMDLAVLLSKTPVLERLNLVSCFDHEDLKISSRSLKYFGYWGSRYPRKLEVDAEQLETFECEDYPGNYMKISFINVPRLAHVSMFGVVHITENGYYGSSISPNDIYHQLRTLFLNPASMYLLLDRWGEHSFENLVELVIMMPLPYEQYDAVKLSCFLHKFPFLQKLCVNVCNTSTHWKQFVGYLPQPRTISTTVHRHLRVVEFCGFFGLMNELELAVYLLKNAISLELMSISLSLCAYKGDGQWVKNRESGYRAWEEEKKKRDLVYQLLSKAASPGTRLVVQ